MHMLVPAVILTLRLGYSHNLSHARALALISISAGVVAFAVWMLSTRKLDIAIMSALRSTFSAFLLMHLFPAADRLVNDATIRVPILRDLLLFASRTLASVTEILEDVQYTYRVEARGRGILERAKLILESFAVVANELVEFIERLVLTIHSRGKYPKLTEWLVPVPFARERFLFDIVMIGAAILAFEIVPFEWIPSSLRNIRP